jgi:DNA-binding GntR family transcriptional regulator
MRGSTRITVAQIVGVPKEWTVLRSGRLAIEFATPLPLGLELAQRLEAEIILLRREPGSRIGEEEVSAQYGVSRSPVREALRALELDGLVMRSPRRGGVVAPLSIENMDAIYACRVPLEGLAAAGVATAADAQTVDALQDAVDRMEAAHQRGDAEAAFWANAALTDLLHDMCGNPVLRRLLDSVNKQALRYRYYAYRNSADFVALAVADNTEMLAAIRARDPDAARAATEQLVRKSWQVVRSQLVARL